MTTTALKLQLSAHTNSPGSTVSEAWKTIQLWRSRARQRNHLGHLTAEQLRDVGITIDARRAEIAKPFWLA